MKYFVRRTNGIIYDRVDGESLLDWVLRTGDLQECAEYMARLHKTIVQNRISNVPNYKQFLKCNILNAPAIIQRNEKSIANAWIN